LVVKAHFEHVQNQRARRIELSQHNDALNNVSRAQQISALSRTALFTAIVPGVVAGYLPLRVIGRDSEWPAGWSYIGIVPMLMGLVIYGWTAFDFAWTGRGTPAPIDPPRRLVVRGLYRYVRNPMYVGVLLVIVGEALLRRSWQTLEYAVGVYVMFFAVVLLLEEPLLRSQFGSAYSQYSSEVPRWVPRRWGSAARRQ
jgi:protein-S-isoprenylcysteine O-methyltransferase Ste14